MSSRSLAAARARRAGENAPPVSGNRPGTSIGSYAQQMPSPSPNVRIARGQPPAPPQQQNAYQQVQQSQQQNQNGLPFTKLSISDAIGLITLRLGRVEQWIIETEHENSENESSGTDSSRTIDASLLTNFINRLDTIEKREITSGSGLDSEVVTKLTDDITKMNEHLAKIVEESSKHSLLTAKHNEQLFRFEREFIETKDILKKFMLTYDQFTNEINDKLSDYEYAISELEKNIPLNTENEQNLVNKSDENSDGEQNENESEESTNISMVDLKSIIKQELASENI
jgi:hypothetical protein